MASPGGEPTLGDEIRSRRADFRASHSHPGTRYFEREAARFKGVEPWVRIKHGRVFRATWRLNTLRKNCGGKNLEEHGLVDSRIKFDTTLDQIGIAMSKRSWIQPTKKSNRDADIRSVLDCPDSP